MEIEVTSPGIVQIPSTDTRDPPVQEEDHPAEITGMIGEADIRKQY